MLINLPSVFLNKLLKEEREGGDCHNIYTLLAHKHNQRRRREEKLMKLFATLFNATKCLKHCATKFSLKVLSGKVLQRQQHHCYSGALL